MSQECLKAYLEANPQLTQNLSWKTDMKIMYSWWSAVCGQCHSAIALEKSRDPKQPEIKISPLNNFCPKK